MRHRQPDEWLSQHFRRNAIIIEACLPAEDRVQLLKIMRHLCRAKQLSRWTHVSGLTYWTRHSNIPLSDSSLVRSLGILLFIHQSEQRMVVTHKELATWFPNLFRHGLPGGHYIDRIDGAPRLGQLRIDASNSKVNRLTTRTTRLVHGYRQQPGFRQLIDNGQFELTWVVPTPVKQQRLADTLVPLAHSGMRLQVVAISELLEVLAPISSS